MGLDYGAPSSINGGVTVPPPRNEPVRAYAPGAPETESLAATVSALRDAGVRDCPMVIGGERVEGDDTFEVVSPHDHSLTLARVHAAKAEHVDRAIRAALDVAPEWAALSWTDRASIFLRAADLLAGPWRDRLNAATIMGQSKSVVQAEIDAACELIDFWRFNCHFAERIYADQPVSAAGMWNYMDYRPLEGFVLAMTPFNFTAIAGNLPTAPALMGNVVVWKPSEKQAYSAQFLMDLFRAAGLPDGVINLVHGSGALVSDIAMRHPDFIGLHFTGSTTVFRSLWQKAAASLDSLKGYPRIVGETGGKDYVVAHPSADPAALIVALGRGAFEYQGQKCSAASRAYVPRSVWEEIKGPLAEMAESIPMGDVADFSNFMGAVIDEAAFVKHRDAIAAARESGSTILAGGTCDDSKGWFVSPTVLVTENPHSDTMVRELFGPILTVFVYDDADWDKTLDLVDGSAYALTGAVFATERAAVREATNRLRHSAGNFYINDKPTGAVVGQQPFGGSRASGTNDKAGSWLNLIRWLSPRTIKETFAPPTEWRYPHMG